MKIIPRRTWLVLAGVVAVMAALAFTAIRVTHNSPESPTHAAPVVIDTLTRHTYEADLLSAPNRTDSGLGAYIDEKLGGRVFVTNLHEGQCESLCMTATKQSDGYAITLPVAYTYFPGSQGFNGPFRKVVQLTYWDSQAHVAKTVTSESGLAVKLPAVLYGRTASSMKTDETAYTRPDYVHVDERKQTVVWRNVQVWYEPYGPYYGVANTARITRTTTGFDVCLPAGYGPLLDGSRTSGSDNLPARILEHC
jgi:hypothetical protein